MSAGRCAKWTRIAAGGVVLWLSFPGLAGAGDMESQRFATFLTTVYQRNLQASPELATEYGSREGDDRWDDTSERAMAANAKRVQDEIAAAKTGFVYGKLDAANQLQYRVFLDEHQLLLDRYRWRNHFYALNQIVGLHIDVPGTLAGNQKMDDERDARAYIRRIRAVKPAFRQLMQHMRDQAAAGIYMPKSVYPLLIEGASNVIAGTPHRAGDGGSSPIWQDFNRRIDALALSSARKSRLLAEARGALLQDLQPAYEDLIRQLKTQEQATPISAGVWQLPEGDAFYAFLIRQFTTTDMTPAQIHEMGLAEVARSQREIAALLSRLGFQGSVRDFMAKMKSDPQNYASDDDAGRAAYLERARNIVSAMQGKITQAFESPAPLPLRVARTEAYKEVSSPPGYYEAGPVDGSRPGTVYLNLSNMHAMPLDELEDLLYHEGVPGHHMQISTIAVDTSIPQLRKVNQWWQDSAFVEGWGLYAERLGKDLGFYTDGYSEFGLLSGELWRATRLVVDSGLHYKHWSRQQAIQYLNDNTPSAEDTNIRAVDRYLAVPGQATSFMVGMRKFVAERERAREALGSRFDLREYHRIALGSGYIPLWALDEKVTAWIAAKSLQPTSDPASTAANPSLNHMFEDYWRDLLALNPGLALAQGDSQSEEQFDDSLQDAWRTRMVGMLDKYLAASSAFSPDSLSWNDQTSLAMLGEQLQLSRDFYSSALFTTARMLPIDQFQGQHTAFAADAAGAGLYPFKTREDYDEELLRAQHFARWSEECIQRLREGMRAGVVLPRMVVLRVLPQLQAHFGAAPESTEFWQPIAAMPATIPPLERTRLQRRYRDSISTVIEPAYRRLYHFMKLEYLPHARLTVGLNGIPGGAALYDYYARYHTTTPFTPLQIHHLGMAEVSRIEAELSNVQSTLGFHGTLVEFFTQVRADAAQRFTASSQIVPAFEVARQQIVGKLPQLFDVMPRAEFQIRALPESSKHSQGNGYYSAAAADGSRPGILWINPYAPGVTDKFNVMTITLHEGLPGHHFQTSVAQEQADLPAFRRFDFTNAYGEGWALYSESLGKELGVFDDPWNYYGHLNYAILRANRLVIDTGLHALGWDVAQGVDWMMQHSSMTREQATAEVERYVAYPGQALSYKIGELKIRELRQRAERALGPRFDLRAFHDQVLLGGSMPLTILERRVDHWISVAPLR